ncbi:dynein regulatory complex subunit 6 isoform X2 [Trachypithecus francoisi]|uniref:dynein regulatory complex subunit 6 isoform X2 n=1 Tax=Trachypithecus francoisi TaxID=54180 RepID=UPI00141BA402|nr:dynein regulatory complex subunit 6 isoform X2 [Trachypithecus francoisi]
MGQGRRLLGASAEVSSSRGPSRHNKPRATWMWRKEMGSELRPPETAQLKAYNRPLQPGASRRLLLGEAGRGAGRQEGRLGRCAPRGDAEALNPEPSFPSFLLWHEASLPPSCPGQRSEGRCRVQPRPLVAGTTPARTRPLVPARGGYERSFSVRPWAMASLRNANPRLKNYFKENYIPQVCEALLCGILVTCPEDPLRYLEGMIMVIIKSGLQNLLWDMCIAPSMKPNIRRLSETYLEQLFELDDQLMTPELMIKACSFYTGHLVRTHFCTWRDVARTNENVALAEKMNRAVTCYHFRLQKSVFHHWHSYMEDQKERLKNTLLRIQQIIYCHKLSIILTKWRNRARLKSKKKEDELILKHELHLKKWKNRLILKRAAVEESSFPEQSSSEASLVDETLKCDISLLPERAILQIFIYLSLKDVIICGQVNHAWMLMTQLNSLWNAIDFSTVKNVIPDKYILSTLQRWRLNVLRLNFRGCLLRPKTFRSVSHCRNLQELNVSDCPTFTDESMRHISEGCPGVLYLNLSNTTITNRTMRLLPRHFHNLQNLSLAYCRRFTDKGLQYLNLGNGCHKLIYLDLSGCTQISVQGFRYIANSCTGITHLTIHDMPTLTDNCVKALVEKCSRITSLVFTGAPHISDCTFKALSTCKLRKIRFEGNKRVTDASFKYIDKNYPNLSHIYMADCKGITDSSLRSLSPLRQLTVLNLANCVRIGDMGLKQFLDGPASIRIRELNLSNCVQLSDASVMKLSERCPNLNYLSLRNCDHLTAQGIGYIVNIFSLVSIDLSGTDISNEGLNVLSRHKKLKELSVSECYRITDVGIQAFCKSSLILEHLDVSYCSQLSDMIIKALAIYCINLTSLSIAGCPKITDSAMEMLSAKCHYLHILDISGCVLLTDEILEDLQIGCKQLRILKMQYCTNISKKAAQRMSSKVQQQEYNSNDPPRWFGYDREGNPLTELDNVTPSKEASELTVGKSTYSSEEQAA